MPWLLPGKIAIACADEEDMPTGSQAPHVPIRSKRGKCMDWGHREQVCEDIANSFAFYRRTRLRSMVWIFWCRK